MQSTTTSCSRTLTNDDYSLTHTNYVVVYDDESVPAAVKVRAVQRGEVEHIAVTASS